MKERKREVRRLIPAPMPAEGFAAKPPRRAGLWINGGRLPLNACTHLYGLPTYLIRLKAGQVFAITHRLVPPQLHCTDSPQAT